MQREHPANEAKIAFEELNALRLAVEERLGDAIASITPYADPQSGGFFHQLTNQKPGDPSKASSATCTAFLVASGRWAGETRWDGHAASLAREFAEGRWESAGLGEGNAFTVSFLLEALHDLTEAARQEERLPRSADMGTAPRDPADDPPAGSAHPAPESAPPAPDEGDVDEQQLAPSAGAPIEDYARFWASKLRTDLIAGEGGLSLQEFPKTTFLTFKAVRVLEMWDELDSESRRLAAKFAWSRLFEESVGVSAGTSGADPFELAYAALTVAVTTPLLDMTPARRGALRHGIDQFFAAQNEDGTWPRSRALFRYPELGNAYCYDYELLVQMLSQPQLKQFLEGKLAPLRKAFDALSAGEIPIGDRGVGWASGHLNPSVTAPESWTTASAYHFCHEFRRFIVDAIRKEVFAYARSPMPRAEASRPPASHESMEPRIDPEKFLDSQVDESHKLREVLESEFLRPILRAAVNVDRGSGLGKGVPNSAILYGPPGTSKTELAVLIAAALRWPLLKLDPSHVTRDGLDRLHAETNLLFTMLAACERIVVLLDEFDELVQDRDQPGAGASSRFLTTAMLPKIAELADRRRIVYLLATNHIERFDDAISRAGRFDLVVPVMPPLYAEKLRRWPAVQQAIDEHYGSDGLDGDLVSILADLTYLEFQHFAAASGACSSRNEYTELIRKVGASSTMRKPIGEASNSEGAVTWKSRIEKEAPRNRLQHG